jgi:hypothetical protein
MVNIFLSYKFSGINIIDLHNFIDPIVDSLKMNSSNSVYCNLYDMKYYEENNMSTKQIMKHALSKLSKCNYQIILVSDTGFSEGASIEFGYACDKMPQLVVIKKDIYSSSLKSLATHVIEYDTLNDLLNKLENFDFTASITL